MKERKKEKELLGLAIGRINIAKPPFLNSHFRHTIFAYLIGLYYFSLWIIAIYG